MMMMYFAVVETVSLWSSPGVFKHFHSTCQIYTHVSLRATSLHCISHLVAVHVSHTADVSAAEIQYRPEHHRRYITTRARRGASECSHFRSRPSIWPHLAATKISWLSQTVQELSHWKTHTHTSNQTLLETSHRYAIAAPVVKNSSFEIHILRDGRKLLSALQHTDRPVVPANRCCHLANNYVKNLSPVSS